MANATAKPSVVATPTSLPPCSKASGIIVSASLVRIAPRAEARTKATPRRGAAARGAVDEPVATEKDQTAGEDARRRPSVTGSRFDGLLDQVEGERTDQHASA